MANGPVGCLCLLGLMENQPHLTSTSCCRDITCSTQFKLAVLTYRRIHGMALTFLADELLQPADLRIRTHLRSALTTSLPVRRTRLSTVGDRAFPVAAARVWNELPRHDTSVPSMRVFSSLLKICHFFLPQTCEVTWRLEVEFAQRHHH